MSLQYVHRQQRHFSHRTFISLHLRHAVVIPCFQSLLLCSFASRTACTFASLKVASSFRCSFVSFGHVENLCILVRSSSLRPSFVSSRLTHLQSLMIFHDSSHVFNHSTESSLGTVFLPANLFQSLDFGEHFLVHVLHICIHRTKKMRHPSTENPNSQKTSIHTIVNCDGRNWYASLIKTSAKSPNLGARM